MWSMWSMCFLWSMWFMRSMWSMLSVYRKDRKELLAREEFIEELSQWGEEKKVPLPGTVLYCTL